MRQLQNLWIQRADLSTTDHGAADRSTALDMFHNHPWQDELRFLGELEARGEESCPPGLGLHADNNNILHLCPVGADEWMVHVHSAEAYKFLGLFWATRDKDETHQGVSGRQAEKMIAQFFHGEEVHPARPAPPEESAARSVPEDPAADPDQFVDLVYRMRVLPPAHRVLGLRTGDGRAVQLIRDPEGTLILRLEGAWTAEEEQQAHDLMQAQADNRPDLVRLVDAEDPAQGVEFPDENQYSVSALIHRLVTEALGADPTKLAIERNYKDHDARPAIAATLKKHGAVEILHRESGVRVKASFFGDKPRGSYYLEVPAASLGADEGKRDRARGKIQDAAWRLNEGDLGSEPDVSGSADDPGTTWGYAGYRGNAKEVADRVLETLCAIVEAPIDVRVDIVKPGTEHPDADD